jgi:cyclopropane-fatty-acyl-phospholipid synthase
MARVFAPGVEEPRAQPERLAHRRISEILEPADIRLNGGRPWDPQIHDQRFYLRVLTQGSLGAGESYMESWWDVEALDEFFARLHRCDPYAKFGRISTALLALRGRLINRQRMSAAKRVAHEHYDLGNDLYAAMLGPRMQYTCAYWPGARNLNEAQENKLHLICRKLYLVPGMRVLDLGCGFGGLSHFMATEYGCHVVSYNISERQVEFARKLCEGLPVKIELRDYREADAVEQQPFDRVVAVGLCEHVGFKNHRRFLEIAHRLLRPRGLFLLHTIGSNISVTSTDAWIDKYIFPNGVLPSIAQLAQAAEGLWVTEDLHNFGPDYDRTLMAWWNNFHRAWPTLGSFHSERFYRMWRYYLLSCAGAFRARKLQLWQVVYSKGDLGSYKPVR